MTDLTQLATRYVAVWNEPNADARRTLIRELWADDAIHLLQPPADIKQSAAAVGMIPVLEIRGHAALEWRVTTAHDRFVAPGEFQFRLGEPPERIRDLVKLDWEMIRTKNGEVEAGGVSLLFLDERDRIVTDYTFIGP
ncbi:MAG: hypothetical protein ACREOG_09570 [Gemmatimonadaceae bacterium]